MTPGAKNFTSGSGVARFELETEESEETVENVNTLGFSTGDTPFRDLQEWPPLQNRTLGGGAVTLRLITVKVSTSG